LATAYLRKKPGDIEGLRRRLGHTSYAMVREDVHLSKEDGEWLGGPVPPSNMANSE
jgi:hypothetical protein